MSHRVHIGDGRLLLPRALCDAHLAGAGGAALLQRDGQVYLVPLASHGAGGLLLKQRNAQGDRVLADPDFLQAFGLGPFSAERAFAVHWDAALGALCIDGLSARVD